jgi:hypothetical protein
LLREEKSYNVSSGSGGGGVLNRSVATIVRTGIIKCCLIFVPGLKNHIAHAPLAVPVLFATDPKKTLKILNNYIGTDGLKGTVSPDIRLYLDKKRSRISVPAY